MPDALTTFSSNSAADRRRWIALFVVCLGQLMIVIDTTIVNVALPSIQRDLDFSQSQLTWVVNAYLVAFGSFLLLGGRLGDLVGRRRVFLAGLALFSAASVVCGLAQDQLVLIAARFVQGLGGAAASAVILAIIATDFPRVRERAKAMSAYMFVSVAGGSIGLLAGGLLTQSISWHWIFFINVPIGVATLALGRALIAENRGVGLREGVDVLGSALVTAALMLGIYAIVTTPEHGWGSAHTLVAGGAAIALLAVFGALQARLANPILPLRMLRVRSLMGASVVRALVVVGMFSTFFLGALYLEHVRGYGAIDTGLAFLPLTLTVALLSLGVTTRLVDRLGPRATLVTGMLATIAGLLLLTRAGVDASFVPTIAVPFVLLGIGLGMATVPLLTLAMGDVPARDAGVASGIVNIAMWLAGAIGLAVLGTVAGGRSDALLAQGHSVPVALTGGYHLAFGIGAACVAAGLLVTLIVLRPTDGARAGAGAPRSEHAEAEAA